MSEREGGGGGSVLVGIGEVVLVGWGVGGLKWCLGGSLLNWFWGLGYMFHLLVFKSMLWGGIAPWIFLWEVIMVDGTCFWGFPLVGRCLLGTCWGP